MALRPASTKPTTTRATTHVRAPTRSPFTAAARLRVTKVCRSWTWLTRAMPPMARPAFQAKKPRYWLDGDVDEPDPARRRNGRRRRRGQQDHERGAHRQGQERAQEMTSQPLLRSC